MKLHNKLMISYLLACIIPPQINPHMIYNTLESIRMPQADGLEMIRKLKEDDCNAKFIILSGYSEFEYAKK